MDDMAFSLRNFGNTNGANMRRQDRRGKQLLIVERMIVPGFGTAECQFGDALMGPITGLGNMTLVT
jgi:hypothetical protein